MNTKKSVIFVLGIATVLMIYAAYTNPLNKGGVSMVFAQKQSTMTKPHLANTTTATTSSIRTQTLNISNANGNFASLQNDQTGKPAWAVSGPWKMQVSYVLTNTMNPTPNLAAFTATLWMAKLDGSSKHSHKISDFKLTSSTVNKNISATFNGMATITMNDFPVKDVPISIKFLGKNTLTLRLDPYKTNNHFGNTPIYSIVWRTH